MRAVAQRTSFENSPPELGVYQKASGQVFLTISQEYEVHALAAFANAIFLQVVDDNNYPAWYPAWLFNVVDKTLPSDWIGNIFHDELELVFGPEFIARDEASYSAMVELESNSVRQFWNRIVNRERAKDGQAP